MFFGKKFSGYHRGRLSGLDILVLSIIKNNNGISGYDIIQKINKKFNDLWKASAGTIYPLLNRLTEKKYVDIEEITENNRQKKMYNITEIGKEALRKILESNLEPSMNTLGDYIKTIIKATVPSEETFEKMMCCFSFPEFPLDEHIDASDYSLRNVNHLERTVMHLTRGRERLQEKVNLLNKKIENYNKILEKIRSERDKNAKPIEIVDDDKEFEDF